MVAAAVAAAGVVGSVAGASISASGAQGAADTQAQAAQQQQASVLQAGRQASNLDLNAINGANSYLTPYSNLGTTSASSLQNLLTGMGNGNAMQALQNMPGYQFELNQGLMATQNGFAAKGLGSSGAAMQGAGQYAQGLASTDLNNYFNQLLSGTQIGANAASLQSQNNANLTTAAGNALMGSSTNAASLGMAGASATAAGQSAAASALGNGISNAGSSVSQGLLLNQLLNSNSLMSNSAWANPNNTGQGSLMGYIQGVNG